MYKPLIISVMSLLMLAGCQHALSANLTYIIEAESGFTNVGEHAFEREEAAFYSAGAALKLPGSVPVGGSGIIEYDLTGVVPKGAYQLSVQYNDENDGHAPIEITVDQQFFSFVMNDDTPSGFEAEENQRSQSFSNVVVGDNSTLRVKGTVDRYQSEHKELVRLDVFAFTPVQ